VGLPSDIRNVGSWSVALNSYYAPTGFNGKFDDEAPDSIRQLKTYLAYDFSLGDPGYYTHLEPQSTLQPNGRQAQYGPSSGHPGVVNHLLADGAVRSVSKKVDFCMYFFLITKSNGDPTGQFFQQ
ncbi:MAG TPA: DUF1559 domain-containing protein, partial [Thermoguttaceae bacterium]|nr:DUF1559 domain-containing protein [Thermoguttaceae bacterium]